MWNCALSNTSNTHLAVFDSGVSISFFATLSFQKYHLSGPISLELANLFVNQFNILEEEYP